MTNETFPARTIDLDAERAAAHRRIDQEAETRRLVYITGGAGQALTYQRKIEEAIKLVNIQGEVVPEDFPMLSATVGIDGDSLQEVAQLIIEKNSQFTVIGATIERTRAEAHQKVDNAQSLIEIELASSVEWPF